MSRLQSLAVQHAAYNTNASMGKLAAAEFAKAGGNTAAVEHAAADESDSDDSGWSD